MIRNFEKTAIITADHSVSYAELLQRIRLFSHYTPAEKGARTLIFSENREGWAYALFSIWANRGIAVPVDAGSTVSDVAYILNDCQPACVWVSAKTRPTVEAAMRELGMTHLQTLQLEDYERVPVSGPGCDWIESDEQDTALIIYTSGTTGSPKGVMLSFGNLWANISSVSDDVPIFSEHRRVMVLLPLHHILPLLGTLVAPILKGGGIAISPGMSGPEIMDTLCRGQIAIMVGVPRLWQALYVGIKKKIDAHAITRALFALCQRAQSPRLSRLIFGSVHKKMGGHLEYCVSGGASLDLEIGRGLRTLGLDVLEGYGMTETAPMISFTRPDDIIPGCVGLPLPTVECRIKEGEVCVKGPNVMQGYYNRPEETAAVMDDEGFLHTGDLGRFDDCGRLYITGRTKEIIVLSNGKNIQPSEIEFQLEKYDQWVKEAAVTQYNDQLWAILVPAKAIEGWAPDALTEAFKREVLLPYNQTVGNYKKVMNVVVSKQDLPRTKLDKLQRYKLKDIVEGKKSQRQHSEKTPEPNGPEYRLLKRFVYDIKRVEMQPTDHIETDLAFDSLDKVELQGYIEESFGMDLRVDQMAGFEHVAAMAAYIAGHRTRLDDGQVDWHQLLTRTESAPLPPTSKLLSVVFALLGAFMKVFHRLSFVGREHIPATGPLLVVPNHESFLDTPALMAGIGASQADDYFFYATEDHVKTRLRKSLAGRANVILMERGRLKESIVRLADVLRQGKRVVLFPEGERSYDGHLGEFKKTFAILACELQVPVLPVSIRGTYEAWPRSQKLPKPGKVTVEFLPVVQPQAPYDELLAQVREAVEQAG
ncbi:MAG: AMP-binding protein [Paludibacteraceae bacterium]|nr:AMP-binding protein [Paludibacteraceae bacterium]